MGVIPTVVSEISARSGRTTGVVGSREASADAFGGAVGQGLQAVGGGLDDLAQGIDIRQEKKRKEDVANRVAQADFTPTELGLRNAVGPDAAGYRDRTLEEYDKWVDAEAENIEDDKAREEFKTRMMAERNNVSSRSAQYEFGTAADNSKNEANKSLISLDNKIRLQPGQYDSYIEQGLAVIDARPGLNATVKEEMKAKWRQASASSRFEGMLERATTVDEVKAIRGELTNEKSDWSSEFSQEGMDRTLRLLDATEKGIATQTDAQARAAIDTLEARANDVTVTISDDELKAVQEVVAKSTNPVTVARMSRIVRDQQIIRETRGLTVEQQREGLTTNRQGPPMPARLEGAIGNAANAFGVNPAYLAHMAQREYGMYLKGPEDQIDYGRGNADGASSAAGVIQAIDGTWLSYMRRADVQAATGLNTASMPDAALIGLKGDPDIAMMVGAAIAADGMRMVKSVTGREATPAELYMVHFLGEGGARTLLRAMQTDQNASAVAMFPKAAAANPTVYTNKDGTSKTVKQLYDELGRTFSTDATYIGYSDDQTRQGVIDKTEQGLKDDPMGFAAGVGNANLGDIFAEGGFSARGQEARSVADYYGIPVGDMKPFTPDEESAMSKAFKEGSADKVLAMVSAMQEMGGDVARAAMKQIGADGNVYAYAGSMGLETGQNAVASDIVRGQKRMEENPDIKTQIGATPSELTTAFGAATGGSLYDVSPEQRQSIQDAAIAHYVETQVARGKAGEFDADAFEVSIQAVLGGKQGAPAIGEVNGQKVILPPGITGDKLDQALETMTVADWSAMSEDGQPPRYSTGQVADPYDLADEARLSAIGAGKYKVAMSDGTFLVTGEPGPNGRLKAYIFTPDVKSVDRVIAQQEAKVADTVAQAEAIINPDVDTQIADVEAARADNVLSTDEINALTKKYGANWAYDRDGNRIVPPQ